MNEDSRRRGTARRRRSLRRVDASEQIIGPERAIGRGAIIVEPATGARGVDPPAKRSCSECDRPHGTAKNMVSRVNALCWSRRGTVPPPFGDAIPVLRSDVDDGSAARTGEHLRMAYLHIRNAQVRFTASALFQSSRRGVRPCRRA